MARASPSGKLQAFVAVIGLMATAAVATFPFTAHSESIRTAALLAILAAVAGARPVNIPRLRLDMVPTHPLILIGLAVSGPMTAAVIGLSGVIGAAFGRRRRPTPTKLGFNLGAIVLSVFAASWTFVASGGRPGANIEALLWPLVGATTTYFLMNTGLVSAAIALEKRAPLHRTWLDSFQWAVASYFSGLSLAVLFLYIYQSLGLWGLALAVPPCWLLMAYYWAYKKSLDEKQRRVEEVEALNGDLDRTVGELQAALVHVKRLQGLIPICMHCKSVRDDKDTWHRLEEYIAEHSEAEFTHSLCRECMEKYYGAEIGIGGR